MAYHPASTDPRLSMPPNVVRTVMPRSPLDELGARLAEDLGNGSFDRRAASPARMSPRRSDAVAALARTADDDDFFGGHADDDDDDFLAPVIPQPPTSNATPPPADDHASSDLPDPDTVAPLSSPPRFANGSAAKRPVSQELPRLNTNLSNGTYSFPPRDPVAPQAGGERQRTTSQPSVLDRARPRPSSFFGMEGQGADHGRADSRASNGYTQTPVESSYPLPRSGTATSDLFSGSTEGSDHLVRRSSFYGSEGPEPIRRPDSTAGSDYGPSSRRSTFAHQQNRSYSPSMYGASPQDPPMSAQGPLLDQSHLKPGASAALLSHAKTLELYRVNVKKTNDPDVAYDFAIFLMDVAREQVAAMPPHSATGDHTPHSAVEHSGPNKLTVSGRRAGKERERDPSPATSTASLDSAVEPSNGRSVAQHPLMLEAIQILKRIADRGHVAAQALLGESYAAGIGTGAKGRPDHDKAFGLFVLAGKHGNAEACYRVGQCCEHGLGCRKDAAKAVTWYNKACAVQHAAAMYRLGVAGLNNELGLQRKQKEGFKWLKRAAELAHKQPEPATIQALHELALLHERGVEHVVFVDFEYAAELLAKASELGYAPSAYRLGECYEYGKMGCPQDSALSIHYYNIAAQQGHREACFALTAWYLVGSPGVLPQSDTEAYLWAKKAAEQGLAKAEYAVGYFTEVGMGRHKDPREALTWFRRAAEHGDKRATQRMRHHNAQQEAHAKETAARQAAARREAAMREAEAQRAAKEQHNRLRRDREARAQAEKADEMRRAEANRIQEARATEARRHAEKRAEQEAQRAERERRAAIRATPGARQDEYYSEGGRRAPPPGVPMSPLQSPPSRPLSAHPSSNGAAAAAAFLAHQPSGGTPTSRLPPGAGAGSGGLPRPRSFSLPRTPSYGTPLPPTPAEQRRDRVMESVVDSSKLQRNAGNAGWNPFKR